MVEVTCPICHKTYDKCNHSLYAMITEYRNQVKQIMEIHNKFVEDNKASSYIDAINCICEIMEVLT